MVDVQREGTQCAEGVDMKTSISLPFVRIVGTLSLAVAGIVACSAGGESTGSTTSAQNAPGAGPTCSPNAGEEACITCCAGTGPASQIIQQANQCFQGCGKEDEACWDRCWAAYDAACATHADACKVAEECIEGTCYGKKPCANDMEKGGDDDCKDPGDKK
jgi:hypothetical protein